MHKSQERMSKFLLGSCLSFALVTVAPNTHGAEYRLPKTSSASLASGQDSAALKAISNGVAKIADQAKKGVVFVSVSKTIEGMPFGTIDPFEFFFGPRGRSPQSPQAPKRKQEGLGSGFIVDLNKGYILTNNHVVQGADEINLKLANDETYEGKVVGRDENTDIAVVQIKDEKFNKKGLGELPLGTSSNLRMGDFTIALGAPFGLETSLSFGVVSALGRGNLQGLTRLGNFIQTDAAINPGNSGGPLLDISGQVVGVNTAIYSKSGGYNGIGFAVPANLARQVAEQLINQGKVERGYIGAQLAQLDPELAKELKVPGKKGVLITKVVPGAPADEAGIEAGDVVTKINDSETKTQFELINTVGLLRPGNKADFTVYRDGKRKNLRVKIGGWPDSETQVASDELDNPLGLQVKSVTKSLQDRYGFESKKGVVVTRIERNSPSQRAGLEEGDVIINVNSADISSTKEFWKEANEKKRLLMRIERSGQYSYVILRK